MKKILITGSTSGLGLSIAEVFLENNYIVYIHGRNRESVISQINNKNCFFIGGDLRDKITLDNIIELIIKEDINIFVSNAAIYDNSGVYVSPDLINDIFTINLISPVSIINRLFKHYITRKSGTIVSINSIAGLNPNYSELIYCTTKHALSCYIKSLQIEAHKYGLSIYDYYPGAIKTNMTKDRINYNSLINAKDLALKIFLDINNTSNVFSISQVIRNKSF